MRIIPFLISAIITIGLIVLLSFRIGTKPPLGVLLSPSHGFWKNAEAADASFSLNIQSGLLKDSVNVFLDERLVPHVFAQNDHDAYFVQGWLHARFRLWQMEFQSYAAAGRLCEILGEKSGDQSILERHDRKFRRLGMLYAAENGLKAIAQDAVATEAVDAYTAGVNSYISQLHPADFPLEYKLLDYAPEPWTNLKTVLILKYMSYDLTTDFDDFAYTEVRKALGLAEFDKLYPLQTDSTKPIVPKLVDFVASRALPVKPAYADSINFDDSVSLAYLHEKPDPDNGSNNWAVSGSRTASGRPILCNDPHLGLNLPSLWYEIQIHTPAYNVYGVSLPGIPTVIIGFNDSIAWGLTNASRDVMDFYEIKFRDSTMGEYWYDSAWKKTEWRTEVIQIKGKADFTDKIPMTVWGPVMYDANYPVNADNKKAYAVKWTALEPSADFNVSMKINRAKNYNEFLDALKEHVNPGQNFVFASKANEIALWQVGKFPAKWRHQGDFIMPGWNEAFKWQDYIPFEDQVHQYNPAWGIVSSANQLVTDTSYPYYLGGNYDVYRGYIIKKYLRELDSNMTAQNMQTMQTSNFNVFAEMVRPVFLKNVQVEKMNVQAKQLLNNFEQWNLNADADEAGMTILNSWWKNFKDTVWRDELVRYGKNFIMPADQVLLEAIIRDSAFAYIDNINTPQTETLADMITAALNNTAENLGATPPNWGVTKDTYVSHLLRIPAFSRMHINMGGGSKIINCTKENHGPSWRMIVDLKDETEAYGVYPGGQSGNPGSVYYDQFIDQWAQGKYYQLWVMKPNETQSGKLKWKISFKKA